MCTSTSPLHMLQAGAVIKLIATIFEFLILLLIVLKYNMSFDYVASLSGYDATPCNSLAKAKEVPVLSGLVTGLELPPFDLFKVEVFSSIQTAI